MKSAFKKIDLIFYFLVIIFDKIRIEIYKKKKFQKAATLTAKTSQTEFLQKTFQSLTIDAFLNYYIVFERYITKQLDQNLNFNNFKNIFAKLFKGVKTKIHAETLLKNKIAA